MRTRGFRSLAASVLLGMLGLTGMASASPVTMNYCVEDIGGGQYRYTFTLTLDNHDNTWNPGYGIGWIVFADVPAGASPLNDFVGDPSSLPIGPWTGYSTTGGGHNGPNLSPVVVQEPPFPNLYWIPNAVGDSLTWRGTSSHLVTPEQMQWSTIFATGGSNVNFEDMTNICGPRGGCCLSTGCRLLTAALCASAGGTYSGDGTTCSSCPAAGACCGEGNCSVLTQAACAAAGGNWQGADTVCPTPSYAFSSSGGAFVDISATGTLEPNTSACDDCTASVPLPFSFSFFGTAYNDVNISSNGNLQFGTNANNAWTNDNPPSASAPNNAIYACWDDLYFDTGGIYYQTDGVSPNRTFTVAWINRMQYSLPGTSENFEVVLHEGTSTFEIRYGTMDADSGGEGGPGGSDYTIGVENANGSAASTILGSAIGTGGTARTLTFMAGTCGPVCGSADFDCDGDTATDADIESFFRCVAGNCPAAPCTSTADFDADGDSATDADIEAFFRVLAGGHC